MIEREYKLDKFISSAGDRLLHISGVLYDTIDVDSQTQTLENVNVTYENGKKTWFTRVLERELSNFEYHVDTDRPFSKDASVTEKIIWNLLFAMSILERQAVFREMNRPFDLPEYEQGQEVPA
jgi:hypothetical protein